MPKTYRVGIIGFAHMHVNNVAAQFAEHAQVEWVACADTIPLQPERRSAPYTRAWNQQHVLERTGIPKTYDDYREMLDHESFDIVIVTCENAQHADVVEACAAAGTHVCVEKPMAMSLTDGLRMVRACQAAATTMAINWPVVWSPAVQSAKQLIDRDAIGRILEVKWRAGHTGPLGPRARHPGVAEEAAPMTGPERGATWWHQAAAGGGALIDYCCYGALLSRWYIGEQASAAIGLRGNLDSQWGDADDNAVVVVRFPKAMALLEGSWTTLTHGVPTGPIVYGTTGTLVVDNLDGRPVVRLERGQDAPEIHEPALLPSHRNTIAAELIHHLETGEALHPTLDMMFNLEVMAILDAGIRSAGSGRLELVDNAAWQIG
jgi:predicted dehydrogenase